MSIFRTVKKIKDCDTCNGTGRVYTDHSRGEEAACDVCGGTGRIEVMTRANRVAVHQAEVATKQMNPGPARKAAKGRLAGDEKESKLGYVEEE
jgi:DnaJ-class molecular chaperone